MCSGRKHELIITVMCAVDFCVVMFSPDNSSVLDLFKLLVLPYFSG